MTVHSEKERLVSLLINDFVKCWAWFFDKDKDASHVALNNSADHAVAMIAVAYALNRVEPEEAKTQLCVCDGNAWLMQGSALFSVSKYLGEYSNPANLIYDVVTIAEACDKFMPCDSQGGFLTKLFLTRLGVEMPEELKHCIDKVGEYETPEVGVELHAKVEVGIDALPLSEELKAEYPHVSVLPHKDTTVVEVNVREPDVMDNINKSLSNILSTLNTVLPKSFAETIQDSPITPIDAGNWDAQANLNEPHLRDLEITVDGMNVFDFPLVRGTSAWVPRFKFIISGDRGLDEEGNRFAYSEAASTLQSIFELDAGKELAHVSLLPHANLSDEDFYNKSVDATAIIKHVVNFLRNEQRDCRVTTDNIHISVKTVDFSLSEIDEAIWK